jgi:hypothetical protein
MRHKTHCSNIRDALYSDLQGELTQTQTYLCLISVHSTATRGFCTVLSSLQTDFLVPDYPGKKKRIVFFKQTIYKDMVAWDVTTCILVDKYLDFGRTNCHHLQGRRRLLKSITLSACKISSCRQFNYGIS